jgi:hypothetical protein
MPLISSIYKNFPLSWNAQHNPPRFGSKLPPSSGETAAVSQLVGRTAASAGVPGFKSLPGGQYTGRPSRQMRSVSQTANWVIPTHTSFLFNSASLNKPLLPAIDVCLQATYSRAIPELLLGSLSIVGAALCLLLPETLYRTLPVALAGGEAFGEGEGIWEFAWCQKPDKKCPDHKTTPDLVSWPKLQRPWPQGPQNPRKNGINLVLYVPLIMQPFWW